MLVSDIVIKLSIFFLILDRQIMYPAKFLDSATKLFFPCVLTIVFLLKFCNFAVYNIL